MEEGFNSLRKVPLARRVNSAPWLPPRSRSSLCRGDLHGKFFSPPEKRVERGRKKLFSKSDVLLYTATAAYSTAQRHFRASKPRCYEVCRGWVSESELACLLDFASAAIIPPLHSAKKLSHFSIFWAESLISFETEASLSKMVSAGEL